MQEILFVLLKLILMILIYVSVTFAIIFLIQTVNFVVKSKLLKYRKKSIRWKYKHVLNYLKHAKYMFLIDFLKWLLIDIKRGRDHFKLFGIWCFTGYYGQGKTLGAVMFAEYIKSMYPDYNIATNFWCTLANIRIEKWEDLLELPKRTIVIFDEIQSTFTSTAWKDFPIELLSQLTQCRKKKLCIFASSPIYSRMAIQLRESTDKVVTCSNIWGLDRMFMYNFYHEFDYAKYCENPLKLITKRLFTKVFVAGDRCYQMYNTEQLVERLDIIDEDKTDSKKVIKEKVGLDRNCVDKIITGRLKEFEQKLIKRFS